MGASIARRRHLGLVELNDQTGRGDAAGDYSAPRGPGPLNEAIHLADSTA